MKTGRSSVMPIDWPASASVGGGPGGQVSIVLTRAAWFPGEKISASPTFSRPDSMRPATMRRVSKR